MGLEITVLKAPRKGSEIVSDWARSIASRFQRDLVPWHFSQREKVLATWENQRPTFLDVVGFSSQRAFTRLYAKGSLLGKKKWFWMDRGTAVRYAHMTTGFQAKTRRRFIGSVTGAGGFSHLGIPLPGIEGREIDQLLQEESKPLVERIVTEQWQTLKVS